MSQPGQPDAHTALQWLELAPTSLLALDAQGALLWANEQARQTQPLPATGQALVQHWRLAADAAAQLQTLLGQGGQALLQRPVEGLEPATLQVSARPLPDGGCLLQVQDASALQAARSEATKLNELLNVARTMGRIGVWERDPVTGRGRWDRQVFRMRGMDGEGEALPLDEAMRHVIDGDREALVRVYQASLQQPGMYAHRFRVLGVDGQLRQLQSNWLVKKALPGQHQQVLGLIMDDTQAWNLARSYDETAQQLAMVVDVAGIVVWRHDLATDRLHYNAQGYRLLGLEPQPDGVSLEQARQQVHPDDLPQLRAHTAQAQQGLGPAVTEARYRNADGQYRSLLMRRGLLRDESGRPTTLIGVALDVTEVQEARRRALELGRRFELATRAAGIGYWSLENGARVPRWSDQMRALHGLGPNDPSPSLGGWLRRHVHPEDRAVVRHRFLDWARSRRLSLETSFRLVTRQGLVRHVVSHARVEDADQRPLFGLLIDVTDQRNAEAALREASERASLAARGAGIATWEADLENHTAIWDEQMWRLRGRAPQAQVPDVETRLQFVHPDDRATMQAINDSTLSASYQFRVVWPDGSVRWLASRSTGVRDATGRVVRRIGVNWDVTDSRTADAARQAHEIAQRENQAKSQFLARMSHELRTPLNAVLGFAQLLEVEERGRDEAAQMRRRRVQHIQSAGRHLLDLINDVLDLSSLESGEVRIALQPVPLAPVLTQTLPLVGPLMDEHEVRLQVGQADCTVLADATRLRQVLVNLLSNAAKYNRPGGQVQVQARCEGEGSERMVLIEVADTGMGMNAQQLAHLFEPFNRLGAERDGVEGTGIGLAIVKALVERMGGSVSVRSQPGEGSVFQVRLADGHHTPAPPAQAQTSSRPSGLQTGNDRSVPLRGSLLYIEDNPVNALIIAELIGRRRDLQLHLATDGEGGVQEAQLLQPDLILLDMHLPDIDGHEVLRRLRADVATAHIPVIALSANAMPDEIERALRAGMSDYWTKPLDFRAFMASIEGLFGPAPAGGR